MKVVTVTERLLCCSRTEGHVTLVSLHNAQVFRLLLKTSVERNKHELNIFLAGFAVWLSLMKL